MGLSAWFNGMKADWERSREVAAARKAALRAIEASDEASVKDILTRISPAELPPDAQEKLLKSAIDVGDAKTFGAVLAFTGNPNATIDEDEPIGRGTIYYHHPLIIYALRSGSHDIALALANDPRADIEKRSLVRGSTALEEARFARMADVELILAGRTAVLRREEAVRWEQEAARLAP